MTMVKKPLHAACENGHADVAAALIAANAKMSSEVRERTPLYLACEDGHIEIVKKLIAANVDVEESVNNPNSGIDGDTPLLIACENGYTDVAAVLLEAGADVNNSDDDGYTPIYAALCATGGGAVSRIGLVQLLSSYGASRSFETGDGPQTAEAKAAERGHHDVLAWLVATRLWSTALHHLELLTPERALALLRGGANIHAAAEPGGPTPLSLARAAEAAGGARRRAAF